jgi:hypothetical protein
MSPSSSVLAQGLDRAHWAVLDLWLASVEMGAALTRAEVSAIAAGDTDATQREHDALAAALNDEFVGRGEDHPVRYWHEL